MSAAPDLPPGDIPRDDVAATLAAALALDATIGTTFVLVGGETLIEDALRTLRWTPPS